MARGSGGGESKGVDQAGLEEEKERERERDEREEEKRKRDGEIRFSEMREMCWPLSSNANPLSLSRGRGARGAVQEAQTGWRGGGGIHLESAIVVQAQ